MFCGVTHLEIIVLVNIANLTILDLASKVEHMLNDRLLNILNVEILDVKVYSE